MSFHDKPQTAGELNRIRFVVKKQLEQILNGTGIVEGWVGCGICEMNLPLWKLYRCYYCGMWICENCCGDHFGKKRELMCNIGAREASAKDIEKDRVDKKVKSAREEKVRARLPGKKRPIAAVGGPQMGDWKGA